MQVRVQLYICPTPGCGDYFGHTGMRDLTGELTGPKTEDRHQVTAAGSRVGVAGKRHSRAECPSCRARDVFVDRVLVDTVIDVPTHAQTQPVAAA